MSEDFSSERIFLDWHRPVLTGAVEWLTRDWTGGVLDLHAKLILTPTAQSARRLREALAATAEERGTGVLAPTVLTPEAFLQSIPRPVPEASPVESQAVWIALLRALDPAAFPCLFPPTAPRPSQDFAWAVGVARKILELRSLLGERGLTIAEALAELRQAFDDPDFWEADRWRELARLEEDYLAHLAEAGMLDPLSARGQAARSGYLPDRIREVILLALPDPLPLVVDAVKSLDPAVRRIVLVHAPEDRAAWFDAWGRPNERWLSPSHTIDIPDDAIHLVGRPRDQGELALRLLAGKPWRDCAIGVPDSDVVPHVKVLLRESHTPAYDPAGRAMSRTPLHEVLDLMLALAADQRFSDLAGLMRHPHFLDFLASRDLRTPPGELPAALDRLQNEHLCTHFEAARHRAAERRDSGSPADQDLAAVLDIIAELLEEFRRDLGTSAGLLALPARLHAERELRDSDPEDQLFAQAAAILVEQAAVLTSPFLTRVCPDRVERTRLVLRVMGDQRLYPAADEAGIELDGWLELHWNDAPHLVVTGMNEGKVPDSVVGHAFLPDRARQALGLLHNERRLVRDAYLLTAMMCSRSQRGSLHIILGKVNADGDTLRPSRLLFRCSRSRLPHRALQLFRDLEQAGDTVPWQRSWCLRPPLLPPPDSITVTAFRDYLACPFRFYLKRVVGMKRLDDRKVELDPMDFGTLCHDALEDFAAEDGLREATDPGPIAEFLVARARAIAMERFGPALPAAVIIQLETACRRLRAAARVQAGFRQEGWRIIEHEYPFGNGRGVDFEGMLVRGVIDRIDRNEDGRLCILDYKTAEKALAPAEHHLHNAPRDADPEDDPLHSLVEIGGKWFCWRDLQLPLYALFLSKETGRLPLCGYFVLPKATSETAVLTWTELTPELLKAAERCAGAVVRAIANGVFWPPNDKPVFDDFKEIFHGSVADNVDADIISALQGKPLA